MLNLAGHEISTAYTTFLKHLDVVFNLFINVKIPTVVAIITFMNRINFMLSSVEHEKS